MLQTDHFGQSKNPLSVIALIVKKGMAPSIDIHTGLMDVTHPPASRLASQERVVDGWSFVTAFAQCIAVYYSVAVLLHFVVPRCIRTKSVQASRQKTSDTFRDALRSLPSLAIKASTLFAAEILHSQGYGRLTDESLVEVRGSHPQKLQLLCCLVKDCYALCGLDGFFSWRGYMQLLFQVPGAFAHGTLAWM